MEHREDKFKGRNNLNLYYQCWLPVGRSRAVLLVVHGLAEHSGRYANLVNYFVPQGYAVYSLDHCGHGKSEGRRCYVDRFTDYLADLGSLVDIIIKEHAGTKIFLFGHSMGGLIAALYAVEHQVQLAGLVLSAPTVKSGASVSWLSRMIAPVLSAVVPKMGVAVLDASAISCDENVVAAYIGDPLVYRGKICARLGAELISTMQQLPALAPSITLPVLIMQGSADKLSRPKGSRLLYELLGSPDKTLKQYEGFYHEVCNEPGKQQVMDDMVNWLAAHT